MFSCRAAPLVRYEQRLVGTAQPLQYFGLSLPHQLSEDRRSENSDWPHQPPQEKCSNRRAEPCGPLFFINAAVDQNSKRAITLMLCRFCSVFLCATGRWCCLILLADHGPRGPRAGAVSWSTKPCLGLSLFRTRSDAHGGPADLSIRRASAVLGNTVRPSMLSLVESHARIPWHGRTSSEELPIGKPDELHLS